MALGPSRLAAYLLPPLLVSCAQYGRVLMEFDSVTGFDTVDTEPATLDFRAEARRWPWVVRVLEGSGFDVAVATVFSLQPGPKELDNPSGFVRERVEEMVEFAGEDLDRTAEIARRLTWLAANDGQTLDQLVTLSAMESILRKLNVDPLRAPFAPRDRGAEAERRAENLASVESMTPWQRGGSTLDEAELRAYVAVLDSLGTSPSGLPTADRAVLSWLERAHRTETDGRLIEPTAAALAEVIRNNLSDTLRRALVAPSPDVRREALLAMYRLSGPAIVPFVLFQLTVAAPESAARLYDPDEGYRRTLLQVCAGMPRDWLFVTFASGPPPIEYVYDTAVRDPSENLRRIGLDSLAHCLERPISFEQSWADEWWRERALRGGQTTVPEPPVEGQR